MPVCFCDTSDAPQQDLKNKDRASGTFSFLLKDFKGENKVFPQEWRWVSQGERSLSTLE